MEDVTGNNRQLNHRLDKVFAVAALPCTKTFFWGGASLVLHIMSYIVWIYVKFPSAKDESMCKGEARADLKRLLLREASNGREGRN